MFHHYYVLGYNVNQEKSGIFFFNSFFKLLFSFIYSSQSMSRGRHRSRLLADLGALHGAQFQDLETMT